MKIGIMGTGIVGRSHGAKLAEKGHDVMIGTRDVTASLARTDTDRMGNRPLKEWLGSNPGIGLGSFAEVADHGEVIINATLGSRSLDALRAAGEENLAAKVVMDISNPLDFSKGMPPFLFVSNLDSLGEQIQRAFPQARVVKTLNTTNALIQVDPGKLANGDHHVFVSGDDKGARATVAGYLRDWYGWTRVIDLGDMTTARGAEMLLPMWLRLFGALQTPMYNFRIVSEKE